jgi:ClpP class serine protease
MDKSKGLDLILHTPGGGVAATESIVEYLHAIFNGDIRAIVPQLAMSAGTMIALSCQSVVMGKHSNLGPVDPQYRGVSCYEALEEFETAKKEVAENPSSLGLWQVILSKYTPTFLISCKHAIKWSEKFTTDWIKNNQKINPQNINNIIKLFVDHESSLSHDRHISKEKCKKVGLNIVDLENDDVFQDLILSLHHCYMLLFDKTNIFKVVDNQLGASYIRFDNKPQG